ncbi:MAG: ABC transporter ATP-binding protein [Erysipelotrichaceae bacterium]
MEDILKVENLEKVYKDFSLKKISFNLPKGCIMGFIGENGSGKTTTIKAILGIIKSSGSISLFGKDAKKDELQIKEDIGVVFDECCFHESFRPKDIDLMLKNIYKQWDSNYFYRLCEEFSLPFDKKIKDLSKGMKMKCSIAAALAHHPKLLIMDEATSGLDPIIRDEILDLFLDFIQDENHSILFSSHITSDVEKIADYVTFIEKGEIVFSQAKDELLENAGILKIGETAFKEMDQKDIVNYRKHAFGYEVLVSDRIKVRKKYMDAILDPARLEDIMLFYARGDKA